MKNKHKKRFILLLLLIPNKYLLSESTIKAHHVLFLLSGAYFVIKQFYGSTKSIDSQLAAQENYLKKQQLLLQVQTNYKNRIIHESNGVEKRQQFEINIQHEDKTVRWLALYHACCVTGDRDVYFELVHLL